MKISFIASRRRGTVLVVTLILALLVSLVAGALLKLSQNQNYLTMRSMKWTAEIPIAEAGIEEAMAHLNSKLSNRTQNGWASNSTGFTKTRVISNDYFFSTISLAEPPVIVSIGYGRIPLQTNYTSRKVMAMTAYVPLYPFVGKTSVTMSGNPKVDSYNSSLPLAFKDHAGVGTLSTNVGAINTGGGDIYGYAATGPGGTVVGDVGTGTWIAGNTGLQPGHVSDDFNMAVPDAALPSPWNPKSSLLLILNTNIGGVLYQYALPAGDWEFGATSLSSGGIYVMGNVRIRFTGDFKMTSTASVSLAPNSTVEIYLGGNMDLSGTCVINPSKIPASCRIYGLPTCTSIKYAGNAEAYCQLYAPNSDMLITGNSDFFGSAVANTLKFQGSAAVHYDEALRDGPEYKVVSWEEL